MPATLAAASSSSPGGSSGLVANNGVFRGEVRSDNFVQGESGYRLLPTGDAELNDGMFRGEVRSANFVEGSSGYRLLPTGDAELNDAIIRGDITAANIESSNFVAGSSGYQLTADGDAEFNAITLRNGIVGDDALAALSRTKVAQADDERSTSIGSSESLGLALAVPSWATTITAQAVGTIHLAGVADSVSCEFYCTIEGNEGPHNAFHVDRASNTGTVHHLRAMTPGNISGNLNVSVTANPINNPGDVFGIKLFISLTAVFER